MITTADFSWPVDRADLRMFTDSLSYLMVEAPLTKRELQIMYLHVIRGMSFERCGNIVGISTKTAEAHYSKACWKIKVESDPERKTTTYGGVYRAVLMMYARRRTELGKWPDQIVVAPQPQPAAI